MIQKPDVHNQFQFTKFRIMQIASFIIQKNYGIYSNNYPIHRKNPLYFIDFGLSHQICLIEN